MQVGAGTGVVTSPSRCPAASCSPGQLLLLQQHRGDLAASAVLEQPTPPCPEAALSAVRPTQSQSCSLQSQVQVPAHRTVYKRLAQITLPTESISMLPTLQSRVTHCIERILLHSNCFGEVFAICSRHQKSFYIYIYI